MTDERVLIGLEGPDDAAVYRLDDGTGLVATLDFFTPMVDGASDFGAIAAANALSDIYAMGARPILGLNVLGVPAGRFAPELVAEILRGAADVCREAGIVIAGGHSIDDPEPKFGLVALGLVDPDHMWRKAGARPGDALVLGKALGVGVITTAIKRELASEQVAAGAIASMRRLNREAVRVLREFDVQAATDVTGFGLLGHLLEVCRASGVAARLNAGRVPVLPGARELAERGSVPGGTGRNRDAVAPHVAFADPVDDVTRVLLADAQTSGGLLAALPVEQAGAAAGRLREAGYAAAVIGSFEPQEGDGPLLVVDS